LTAGTFLMHSKKDCSGPVVIDTSSIAKLIAPSFSIGPEGFSNIVLDLQLEGDGILNPEYECTRCGEHVDKESFGTDISAICQICGNAKPAEHLFTHNYVPCICEECVNEVKDYIKTGKTNSDQVKLYTEMFSFGSRPRFISMLTLLNHPISMKGDK